MKLLGRILGLFALAAGLAGANTAWAQAPINQDLPLYRPADQLSGQITLVGSNTMAQLAAGWIDGFRQFQPNVKVTVTVNGARSAVTSLIDGSANLGMLSRTITKEEIDAFEGKFGYPPQVLTPALERIAIYVHKDNPVRELTLAQLQSIFSQDGKVRTWGDVGVSGAWAGRTISLQGRGPTTGSSVYFQAFVLRGENFNDRMRQHSTNPELIAAIENTPDAIGYAGLLFQSANIKAVPLAVRSGLPAIAIDGIEADQGQYPLMRPLQIVVNHPPGKDLPVLEREFLKYVFSRFGQEEVIKGGFQPIPGATARVALGQVGVRELN